MHNIPDGGWQRDYYDYITGDTGDQERADEQADDELNAESLYETARPEVLCDNCGGPADAPDAHYYRDGESGEYNAWMCETPFKCCGANASPCKSFKESCHHPANYPDAEESMRAFDQLVGQPNPNPSGVGAERSEPGKRDSAPAEQVGGPACTKDRESDASPPEGAGPTCEWAPQGPYSDWWNSGCGEYFVCDIDGAPVPEWMKFCPYCGSRAVFPQQDEESQ